MYSIKEAASRSGVSIPTLRAWERRYGVVEPTRTPGGYRLYDDEAIARLKHMRALVTSGWRPREAAQRVVETAAAARQRDEDRPIDATAGDAGVAEAEQLIRAFVRAAVAYDTAGMDAVLNDAFARGSFEWAIQTVLFPALEEVGLAWERGDLDVAAEHAASETVLRRLALFYEAAARSNGTQAVIGLPPGARHDLGALAFAVAARRLGVGVLFLGADVPVDSWISAIRESGAEYAIVAVPTANDAEAAADVIRVLGSQQPHVHRLVGGAGAALLPATLGAVALPESIGEAGRTLASLVARS